MLRRIQGQSRHVCQARPSQWPYDQRPEGQSTMQMLYTCVARIFKSVAVQSERAHLLTVGCGAVADACDFNALALDAACYLDAAAAAASAMLPATFTRHAGRTCLP